MNAEAYRWLACSTCGFRRQQKDFPIRAYAEGQQVGQWCDEECKRNFDAQKLPTLSELVEEINAGALSYTETLGPQEPPNDPRIYNRRMPNGMFRPLSGFFEPRET